MKIRAAVRTSLFHRKDVCHGQEEVRSKRKNRAVARDENDLREHENGVVIVETVAATVV